MSVPTAFKCPETGDVVRPSGGRCPACGADQMRGHMRLVGREWVLEPEDGQELLQTSEPAPVVEFTAMGPVRPRRQVVTPELLRRWRVSRPWLKAREPELLACGWNKGKLYRIRPPFGRSYHWGVAWGWGWTLPHTEVRIGAGGAIEFCVTQPDGRVNIMAAQPR